MEKEGVKSVVPLDALFMVDKLPFKMTIATMLKAAYWAQNQCSYQLAEEIIADVLKIFINDDTIRAIANYVGGIVFRADCSKANEAYSLFSSGKLPYAQDKSGILYIELNLAREQIRNSVFQ
jgi:hypothetical protein